jgi:hypothetical protein
MWLISTSTSRWEWKLASTQWSLSHNTNKPQQHGSERVNEWKSEGLSVGWEGRSKGAKKILFPPQLHQSKRTKITGFRETTTRVHRSKRTTDGVVQGTPYCLLLTQLLGMYGNWIELSSCQGEGRKSNSRNHIKSLGVRTGQRCSRICQEVLKYLHVLKLRVELLIIQLTVCHSVSRLKLSAHISRNVANYLLYKSNNCLHPALPSATRSSF